MRVPLCILFLLVVAQPLFGKDERLIVFSNKNHGITINRYNADFSKLLNQTHITLPDTEMVYPKGGPSNGTPEDAIVQTDVRGSTFVFFTVSNYPEEGDEEEDSLTAASPWGTFTLYEYSNTGKRLARHPGITPEIFEGLWTYIPERGEVLWINNTTVWCCKLRTGKPDSLFVLADPSWRGSEWLDVFRDTMKLWWADNDTLFRLDFDLHTKSLNKSVVNTGIKDLSGMRNDVFVSIDQFSLTSPAVIGVGERTQVLRKEFPFFVNNSTIRWIRDSLFSVILVDSVLILDRRLNVVRAIPAQDPYVAQGFSNGILLSGEDFWKHLSFIDSKTWKRRKIPSLPSGDVGCLLLASVEG